MPGHIEHIQIPLRLKQHVDARLSKNRSQRSRGFVFTMLGAVCARVQGESTLYVYENGIGAINLPFNRSTVARDHAVSVHPLSLQRLGNLLSMALGTRFTVVNPFLLSTKA